MTRRHTVKAHGLLPSAHTLSASLLSTASCPVRRCAFQQVGSARLEVLKLKPTKDTKANAYFAALDKAGQMMTLAGMYAEVRTTGGRWEV